MLVEKMETSVEFEKLYKELTEEQRSAIRKKVVMLSVPNGYSATYQLLKELSDMAVLYNVPIQLPEINKN